MDRSSSNGLIYQLWFQVIVAMVIGVLLGHLVGDPAVNYLGWLGTVFVRALKFVIVPLVLFSVAGGVASVGSGKDLSRLGLRTLGFYLGSSLAAILIGQAMVNLIRPGVGLSLSEQIVGKELPAIGGAQGPLDILLRFLPQNPIASLAQADMMGIIGFAILVGLGITQAPRRSGDFARSFIRSAFDVMMVLTGYIIKLAPIGVLGLVTRAAAEAEPATVLALIKYVFTIAASLVLHVMISLPILLIVLGRINPINFYWSMRDALLTAFSTSSSSATLPVTLRTIETEAGVSNRVGAFVVPLGATVNMDGTALYECVGVIFIAQALGYPLDFSQQMIIVVTALAASVGAAGIPSAGLVMIFVVLEAVGIKNSEAEVLVGVMLAIDRPLDMMRTAVNVLSDSCAAVIVARGEGETLAPGIALGSSAQR